MRMDKMTLKAQDAVNTAQNIATDMNQYEIQPEHLLLSLVDQDGGIFGSIAQKIGASIADIRNEVNGAVKSLPRQVGAGPGGGALSPSLRDVLNEAWNEAGTRARGSDGVSHYLVSLCS